jgi:hypothetical protein
MKQFARCTNCRQWYAYSFTMSVEIFDGCRLPRTTMWCCRCITDAEHRSQDDTAQKNETTLSSIPTLSLTPLAATGHDTWQQLVQEHTTLMERAIHEEDTVLVPIIEEFIQRCRSFQAHTEHPEHGQRLMSHVQYWKSFLNALHQSQ